MEVFSGLPPAYDGEATVEKHGKTWTAAFDSCSKMPLNFYIEPKKNHAPKGISSSRSLFPLFQCLSIRHCPFCWEIFSLNDNDPFPSRSQYHSLSRFTTLRLGLKHEQIDHRDAGSAKHISFVYFLGVDVTVSPRSSQMDSPRWLCCTNLTALIPSDPCGLI